MTEDRYTSTPEDAAAFERSRAEGLYDDRPSPAELAEDEPVERRERKVRTTMIAVDDEARVRVRVDVLEDEDGRLVRLVPVAGIAELAGEGPGSYRVVPE